MAKKQRDPAKEARWRDIVEQQSASGLTVRAFCQRKGLGESAFHFWRRTIRQRDADGKLNTEGKPISKTPAFVPALIRREPEDVAMLALKLADGLELRFPHSISAARVAELAHALETRGNR